MRFRRGFTLIEVLVSLTLMAFLMTTATYAFTQVKAMTARIQARQAMHNSARLVYERLRTEIDAMHQGSAFFLRSGGGGGDVELVFLSGRYDLRDFSARPEYESSEAYTVDHLWSRWHWSGPGEALTSARNRPLRRFVLNQDWAPDGINYRNQTFAILTQAQREAGTDPISTLNRNAFGTPSLEDRGDYTDLVAQAQPIALDCSDLRFEVVLADGSIIGAAPDRTSSHAIDGLHINGEAGGTASRPRLIRMRFALSDPRLDLSETFSFTFRAPGTLP